MESPIYPWITAGRLEILRNSQLGTPNLACPTPWQRPDRLQRRWKMWGSQRSADVFHEATRNDVFLAVRKTMITIMFDLFWR